MYSNMYVHVVHGHKGTLHLIDIVLEPRASICFLLNIGVYYTARDRRLAVGPIRKWHVTVRRSSPATPGGDKDIKA